ncbi:hypothetical protein CA11_13870 [Gimesia maris]|uniref:hypothetical protein n=1 Tax=Gimesia maris TaxID=122 RepID=UPI00118BB519|nr:hypothetical protein [Gimesia maris]QDU13603.1 hypothetical protein CA11_13870 [Gimesia maris]
MSNGNPGDWLPELLRLDDCENNWELYLEAVYQAFVEDFVDSKPTYTEKKFALKRYPITDGKECTFWHLISEGANEEERLPDLRRCERIKWPRPMIESIQSGNLCVWRNKRGRENRILIASSDFSYVVVLADRSDYVLLWTAYCVEKNHSRRKMESEYSRWKNGEA